MNMKDLHLYMMNFVRQIIICGATERNLQKGSDVQMKFYDKDLTQKEIEIKNIIWILLVFTLGFIVGYFTMNIEMQTQINNIENIKNQYVE